MGALVCLGSAFAQGSPGAHDSVRFGEVGKFTLTERSGRTVTLEPGPPGFSVREGEYGAPKIVALHFAIAKIVTFHSATASPGEGVTTTASVATSG